MLKFDQFTPNEAWVAFQLNDLPFHTERDGDYNCLVLMDAASGFLLGTSLFRVELTEPPEIDVRRLFKTCWRHSQQYPLTLFVARLRFPVVVPAEAARNGITVVRVDASELVLLTSEARAAFRQRAPMGEA